MFNEFEYLESLNENKIDLGLSRIKKVLQILGNIQNTITIIHIAGTNGKGSTSNFINDILINNCLTTSKVGLFTSPHINQINERIKINNKNIPDIEFKTQINNLKNLLETNNIKLTYFEFITVIAIKYFHENNVDIAIFECGLGGRLDSTNIFKNTLITLITNIDIDHTEYLGNTLHSILNEKMGIMRKNTPIVSSISQTTLKPILRKQSNTLKSPLYLLNDDFFITKQKNILTFKYNDFSLDNIILTIKGKHQYKNLALALMTIYILQNTYKYKFQDINHIKYTIANFKFSGRLELIESINNNLNLNILFDVGHNHAGIKSFVKYIKTIKLEYRNIVIIFGMLKDKQYKKCIKEILQVGDFFYLTTPNSARALNENELLKEFYRHNEEKKVKLSSKNSIEVINNIKNQFSNLDLICIIGSFYIISDFKKHIKIKANE